ncbi:hypothetical protein VNO78_17505 [Psophocarpus tetragonolobus]|uniref:Uncharacterized protein n=1 Tax=Psophocarpus tetragonolobus TaxID=3891 RepID=A0AAN9SIF1_PSOTE
MRRSEVTWRVCFGARILKLKASQEGIGGGGGGGGGGCPFGLGDGTYIKYKWVLCAPPGMSFHSVTSYVNCFFSASYGATTTCYVRRSTRTAVHYFFFAKSI